MKMLRILGWLALITGLLAAVPLWVALLLPETQAWHALASLYSALIPFLWLPTLVALAGGIVVTRHLPRLLIIGLTSALATYWAILLIGPLHREQPPAGEVQFITLNSRYGQVDIKELLDMVGPETTLLAIQELTPELLTKLEDAGISQEFPHFIGEARSDASGTGIYSRVPIELVALRDEVFLNLLVQVSAPSGEYYLAAVHCAPPQLGATSWREDAKAIAELLRPYASQRLLVIGDFNAIAEQVTMSEFYSIGLTDALHPDGATSTGLSRWEPTWPVGSWLPPTARIDHFLVSEKLRPAEPHYFVVSGTDHKAIRGGVWRK